MPSCLKSTLGRGNPLISHLSDTVLPSNKQVLFNDKPMAETGSS